jgi:hypothetical protein
MIDISGAVFQLNPNIVKMIGDIAYDKDGNQVAYDPNAALELTKQNDCKQLASQLLYDTDWTTIADVANPINNPYLTNQAEFIAYRNIVRGLAVNPVVNPVFPDLPTPAWSK